MENQSEVIVKLELSVNEVNTILQGLQEVAAKVSNPLTAKIVGQADPQLKAQLQAAAA